MLIRKEYSGNGSIMGIWKMDETTDELLNLFPPVFRSEADRFLKNIRSERRAKEWLSTRILLKKLLGELKIILNMDDGKPYLADQSYHISISHTQNHAAILLHEIFPVGIDIEMISDRVEKLAYKFISENEFIDTKQKLTHLLLHWSVKECMFKLINEQGIDFKKHLQVHPFTPSISGEITATETRTDENKTYKLNYEVHTEYVLTWVVDN